LIHGGGSVDGKRFLFSETYRFNRKRSVRGPRYKLIYTGDTGVGRGGVRWKEDWELFDILKDPLERHNLISEDLPAAEVLAARLKDFELRRGDDSKLGPRVKLSREDLRLLRSLGYVE
jgi:hypothetical protein